MTILKRPAHQSGRVRARERAVAAALALAVAGVSWTTATRPVEAQGDTQPPTVVSRSPAPGASGVSTQISVRALFSEPIQPSSLSFVLKTSGGAVVPAVVAYDDATRAASLTPTNDLQGAATYTATVSGVRDLAGNQISAPVVWSFATGTPVFQESTALSGLTEPTAIEFAADGRVFVAEKSGLIKVFASIDATTSTVFADLRTKVYNYWDRGLLGLALHPQFPSVPYVYVLYTYDAPIGGTAPVWGAAGATSDNCPSPPGATADGCVVSGRLSRLQAAGNVTTGPELVLINDWFQQYPSHSIGSVLFGPDGALYASGGDGASFNYVDYGQNGNPKNPGGDPPVPVGGTQTPPTAEGGALRSQDLRTPADPVTLDGALIRIDPDTAAAPPDNPLVTNPDPNARRLIAHGFRNPYRFTFRPNTREVWVGDVGWGDWEEINRVADATDAVVENFGWPCYEGNLRQPGYEGTNLNLCTQLYSQGSGAVVAPFYTYKHTAKVSTETCATGSSAISGLAFYSGTGNYPSTYAGALFFSDYARNCIWVMLPDGSGVPNPATIVPFLSSAVSPVQLKVGPDGVLYYVSLGGTVRRVRYFPGNQPPKAQLQATPTSGVAPLAVSLSASGSSDPENGALVYAWDLDGDGQFNDGSGAQVSWTYASGANVARVRVTDPQGLFDVAAVTILVSESYPTATIDTPAAGTTWKVGDVISFSGSATDPEDGVLAPGRLSWAVRIQHCPSTCHVHPLQTFDGVAAGSFSAPDHEYPSYLELILTATDSGGLQDSKTLVLQPQTTSLAFGSSPTGLQLTVGPTTSTAPFNRTVILGSNNSMSAASPQGGYQFQSWSDGGAQTHDIVAGAGGSYTATFSGTVPSSLVLGLGLEEGAGTAVADVSGSGNNGTVSSATWAPGKFGGGLSFNGTTAFASVPDSPSLDLGSQGTVDAWVKLSAINRWNGVLSKGSVNVDEKHNYSIEINSANRVSCVLGNGTTFIAVTSATQLAALQFYHLACVWDGTQLRVYVNGALDGTLTQSIVPAGNTSPLFLGRYGDTDYLAGTIDEVRVRNAALTAAQIQADMNTPLVTTGSDTTPPVRSNGQPSGTLAAGTTQTTLSLATSENAVCRYGTTPGVAYASLPNAFSTTGGASHSTAVSGLTGGASYTYYVRCQDGAGNANPDDFTIAFGVASSADTTPPVRSNGQPSGTLAAGTTQTTLSLATNENAVCRYGTTAGVAYASLPNAFTTTGGASHSTPVSGLSNGASYTYYVRCQDGAGNANTNDFAIAFSVASAPSPVHVGDLTGSSSKTGNGWRASVVVLVVDGAGAPVSGATVNASWSAGYSASTTCTTATNGTCTAQTPKVANSVPSVTFTVTGITHATRAYAPGANVSTAVVVGKP